MKRVVETAQLGALAKKGARIDGTNGELIEHSGQRVSGEKLNACT